MLIIVKQTFISNHIQITSAAPEIGLGSQERATSALFEFTDFLDSIYADLQASEVQDTFA